MEIRAPELTNKQQQADPSIYTTWVGGTNSSHPKTCWTWQIPSRSQGERQILTHANRNRINTTNCFRIPTISCFRIYTTSCYRIHTTSCYGIKTISCYRIHTTSCYRMNTTSCYIDNRSRGSASQTFFSYSKASAILRPHHRVLHGTEQLTLAANTIVEIVD